MAFVQLKNINLAYGDRAVLSDVSFTLDAASRAALAGANGAGKSTLMKILAGQTTADSGEIIVSKGARISYMAQSQGVNLALGPFGECLKAFDRFFAKEKEIEQLSAHIDDASLQKAADLHDELALSGFYAKEGLIDATLRGLGFKKEDFNKPLENFSSGWRMRAALARILLEEPDILLLDEPSNFLDLEASMWLLDWIKRFPGGLLLVSHDRYFLDKATNETLELFNGKMKRYAGSYSQYEKKRAQEIEELIKTRAGQEERLKQIEEFARKYRAVSSRAALVQSRLKEAEKIELAEIPENLKKIHIRFPDPPPCGERVLFAEGLNKSYNGKPVFEKLNMLVMKGEKVAVAGVNGAGKSTFLRIAAGIEKADSGFLKLGSGVMPGYFSEDTHEPMLHKTVLEEAEASAPFHMQAGLRGLLASFLFRGDDIYKPVSGLSGGEKARMLLLKLFLKPFNLLILDEPTNHLDLQSKDALLEALKNYKGSVLFVSHDRLFIEELAQYVLAVSRQPIYYPGGYRYYLEQEAKRPERQEPAPAKAAPPPLSREEQKRRQACQRRKEKQEAQLLQDISDLEQAKDHLQAKLALPEVYSDGQESRAVQQGITELEGRLAALYSQWEALQQD